MIKKVLCSLSLLGIIGFSAKAQTINPCVTDEVYRRLLAEHPEIAEKDAALNIEIANKISKMTIKDLSPFAKKTDDGNVAYDVPIVFHVIHDYGAEYVTDDQIRNCVARMNNMYNKRNADTIDVIPPFKGFIDNSTTRYIGNARITWHLATKDPNGNPTIGITRRRSYITKNAGDLAKYDLWAPESYMNVWVISTMSPQHSKAAAYAYKPATADGIPYYDGPIMMAQYISEIEYTLTHELGHELNLDHTWGSTNDPTLKCGDDAVEDTPPTKGHDPAGGCSDLVDLYDDSCLINYAKPVGKYKLDTTARTTTPVTVALRADTSTKLGITFKNRTASTIDSFAFYPAAAIGSTYKIGLSKNGVLIDSVTVVSTVINNAQLVRKTFKLPRSSAATDYKLYFIQNPGAWRDTLLPSATVKIGENGTVWIKNYADSTNYYNFFYDWKITYGNYKFYGTDSLVDYPDTTNAQNVMDYTYCSKMFTYGQTLRMRAALTSPVAKRNNLITPENLAKTGALDPTPNMKPKAEYSVEKGALTSGVQVTGNTPSYFMCADNPGLSYNFVFKDRSWQSVATSRQWLNSGTSTATTGTTLNTKFTTPGWVSVKLVATNANGSDTFETNPGIYVADPATKNPIGFYQEFDNATENAQWPIFNYFNNRYKWEIVGNAGVYDNKSIRYRTYDDRTFPDNLLGDPTGDYDDFYTPAFDLSTLGAVNGNLNFMYAGAYATNNAALMKDQLEISYSTTCGANWTVLKTMKDAEMQTIGTIPVSSGEYRPDWNEWKPMSIDLKSGTSTIRDSRVFFRFRYKPSARNIGNLAYAAGNNFYIDRINISDNPLSVNEMILGNKQIALAPNPTTANTFVLFQKPNAHVKIQVLDMTGKLVYSINTNVNQNNARVEIPVTQFAAKGVYLIRVTGDDNLNQTEKLVVY